MVNLVIGICTIKFVLIGSLRMYNTATSGRRLNKLFKINVFVLYLLSHDLNTDTVSNG